jgi:hypothetical protein
VVGDGRKWAPVLGKALKHEWELENARRGSETRAGVQECVVAVENGVLIAKNGRKRVLWLGIELYSKQAVAIENGGGRLWTRTLGLCDSIYALRDSIYAVAGTVTQHR